MADIRCLEERTTFNGKYLGTNQPDCAINTKLIVKEGEREVVYTVTSTMEPSKKSKLEITQNRKRCDYEFECHGSDWIHYLKDHFHIVEVLRGKGFEGLVAEFEETE